MLNLVSLHLFQKMMDCDIERRRTRNGRTFTQLVLLPDADISDPDNESDSDVEITDDDDIPLSNYRRQDSSSSSDEDVPLSSYRSTTTVEPNATSKNKLKCNFRWRKRVAPTPSNMAWTGSFSNPPNDASRPIDYFHKFFTNELVQHIVEQTNVYAIQTGSSFRTDSDEIEQYLGVLLKMGIVAMPRYRMYWSRELRFPPVADVMSRNRFDELGKHIHFNDNTELITNRDDPAYDRYFKVRPMLSMLRDACLQTEPEEKMSIDEQMIPYKGKNSLRQYLPKKPKKWGFKVLARCGVSGIMYDFLLYEGKGPTVTESTGFQSADFVIKLCETLPKQMNFKLYFDNWFTFLELQLQLKASGIWSVGTIRSNRMRGCTLQSEKELKKQGRGAYDYCVDANSGLSVVRWMDNSAVQLASSHVAVEPLSSIRRWDKKQRKYADVTCPAIVKEYNEHMGGVDLFDMLMSLYKVDHKSVKWYRRIFFWVLNVAVVNGWILYRRHSKQKNTPVREQLDLMQFTARVSESLVLQDKMPPLLNRKRPGRPSRAQVNFNTEESSDDEPQANYKKRRSVLSCGPSVSVRYDNTGHFPAHSEPKQRCKVCHNYVRMICMKCNCHLCVTKDKNCFLEYHTAQK